MVTLPPNFVKTYLPGYFWNVAEQKLYSIKVTGGLRPLKYHKGFYGQGRQIDPGYKVSHQGHSRNMTMMYLRSLGLAETVQEIEVFK